MGQNASHSSSYDKEARELERTLSKDIEDARVSGHPSSSPRDSGNSDASPTKRYHNHKFVPILEKRTDMSTLAPKRNGVSTDVNKRHIGLPPPNSRSFRKYSTGTPTSKYDELSDSDVDEDLSESRRKHDIPKAVTVDYVVEKVQHWAGICDELHPVCTNDPLKPSQQSALPTRVLDLGDADTTDVKIAAGKGIIAKYVALSYCWGRRAGDLPKITKETLPVWTTQIPSNILPVLFQEIISITRALGLRYLWIDSLCILQDDVHDWERESGHMAAVYEGSWLTIAATFAPSPRQTLFDPRIGREISFGSKDPRGPRIPGGFAATGKNWARSVRHYEMGESTRTVTQLTLGVGRSTDDQSMGVSGAPSVPKDTALPRRRASLGMSGWTACECGELEVEAKAHKLEDWEPTGWLKKSLMVVKKPNATIDDIGYVWLDLVSEFSRLDLTKDSDRLPALSGIASTMSDGVMGPYVAGLWRNDVARCLMFERTRENIAVTKGVNFLEKQCGPSRPSWSWASLELRYFSINYDTVLQSHFLSDPEFFILEASAEMESSQENHFSWAANTTLQLCGRLVEAKFLLVGRHETFLVTDEDEGRQSFSYDGTSKLVDGDMMYCLLVGSVTEHGYHCGLVLKPCDPSLNTFHRVGVLGTSTRTWFMKAPLSDCVLV